MKTVAARVMPRYSIHGMGRPAHLSPVKTPQPLTAGTVLYRGDAEPWDSCTPRSPFSWATADDWRAHATGDVPRFVYEHVFGPLLNLPRHRGRSFTASPKVARFYAMSRDGGQPYSHEGYVASYKFPALEETLHLGHGLVLVVTADGSVWLDPRGFRLELPAEAWVSSTRLRELQKLAGFFSTFDDELILVQGRVSMHPDRVSDTPPDGEKHLTWDGAIALVRREVNPDVLDVTRDIPSWDRLASDVRAAVEATRRRDAETLRGVRATFT